MVDDGNVSARRERHGPFERGGVRQRYRLAERGDLPAHLVADDAACEVLDRCYGATVLGQLRFDEDERRLDIRLAGIERRQDPDFGRLHFLFFSWRLRSQYSSGP
jgi:hypothetical protein